MPAFQFGRARSPRGGKKKEDRAAAGGRRLRGAAGAAESARMPRASDDSTVSWTLRGGHVSVLVFHRESLLWRTVHALLGIIPLDPAGIYGRITVVNVQRGPLTMYKSFVIILCFSGRILRDVRAADSAPLMLDTTSCQNNYEADNQLFHVNGKQWRANTVPLKEGYVVTRGIGAHKLHRRKVKWNAARQACVNEGGDLAVINSLAEESVLLTLVRQANLNEVWIGTHDLFEEGDWVTVTGESLEKAGFDKWSTVWPQPDNYGGQQNCGALLKEGGMDDMECQVLNAFFCELNIY